MITTSVNGSALCWVAVDVVLVLLSTGGGNPVLQPNLNPNPNLSAQSLSRNRKWKFVFLVIDRTCHTESRSVCVSKMWDFFLVSYPLLSLSMSVCRSISVLLHISLHLFISLSLSYSMSSLFFCLPVGSICQRLHLFLTSCLSFAAPCSLLITDTLMCSWRTYKKKHVYCTRGKFVIVLNK